MRSKVGYLISTNIIKKIIPSLLSSSLWVGFFLKASDLHLLQDACSGVAIPPDPLTTEEEWCQSVPTSLFLIDRSFVTAISLLTEHVNGQNCIICLFP